MNSLRKQVECTAADLQSRLGDSEAPDVFIQTGSGFHISDVLDKQFTSFPLSELSGMPATPSPAGHPLHVYYGRCGNKRVLLSEGRHHFYEGHGCAPCVLPLCAAILSGARASVLVAAAGGVTGDHPTGTLMTITDSINNIGASPLSGTEPLGKTFFVDMTHAFSQALISGFINAACRKGIRPRLGVYQANRGPEYETPSEVAAARARGVDAVGMSIVLETIAARALDCPVLGLAYITNPAAAHGAPPLSHTHIEQAGDDASEMLAVALREWMISEVIPDKQ